MLITKHSQKPQNLEDFNAINHSPLEFDTNRPFPRLTRWPCRSKTSCSRDLTDRYRCCRNIERVGYGPPTIAHRETANVGKRHGISTVQTRKGVFFHHPIDESRVFRGNQRLKTLADVVEREWQGQELLEQKECELNGRTRVGTKKQKIKADTKSIRTVYAGLL